MKKQILIAGMLLGLAFTGRATQIVYDPALHAQTAADHIVDFAKWAKTEVDAAQTELNTLNQYEQTLLYVTRFGNPAALRSIPGVSTVAELYSMYGQLQQGYQQLQGMTNPRNLQYSYNSILSSYSQPQWNGFQSLNGTSLSPNPGLYQFPTLDYNVGATMTQQLDQLEQKKKQLTQERDNAFQSLQSATTSSDVQKYPASLTALNAAIADVNQSEQQLYNRGRIQQSQNASAQQIYRSSQAEQRAAAAYQGIDNDLSALPSDNFRQGVLWGSN